jgi:hypothetical protein
VYYTARVAATASRIEREVMSLSASLFYIVEAAEHAIRGRDDILIAYRLRIYHRYQPQFAVMFRITALRVSLFQGNIYLSATSCNVFRIHTT